MAEPRRLKRQNGIIAGVCGGIAARFGWSAFIARLIFFISLLQTKLYAPPLRAKLVPKPHPLKLQARN